MSISKFVSHTFQSNKKTILITLVLLKISEHRNVASINTAEKKPHTCTQQKLFENWITWLCLVIFYYFFFVVVVTWRHLLKFPNDSLILISSAHGRALADFLCIWFSLTFGKLFFNKFNWTSFKQSTTVIQRLIFFYMRSLTQFFLILIELMICSLRRMQKKKRCRWFP